MNRLHAGLPPRYQRRRSVKLDNIALVPASMLPFREEWHAIANDLPRGAALFVVPDQDIPMKRAMRKVAASLRQRGRSITAIQADRFPQNQASSERLC